MENSTHFVARIVVERVDIQHTEPHPTRSVTAVQQLAAPRRTVTELATVTVKANDMAALIDKADAHMHLVEDIGATDPRENTGAKKPSYRATDHGHRDTHPFGE